MTTNILSRILPPARGEPSIYETLRQNDELDHSDIEERAGMAADEEELGARFRDHDDTIPNPSGQTDPVTRFARPGLGSTGQKPTGRQGTRQQAKGTEIDELDDEVPPSLLIEGEQDPMSIVVEHQRMQSPPTSGPLNTGVRAKWQVTQQQQRLYQDVVPSSVAPRRPGRGIKANLTDPKERALWIWANIENLDNFLAEIYEYYTGNGIWSITLTRMLNLLTLAFVVAFSTFLGSCVDYKKIPRSKKMAEILVPKCTQRWSTSTNIIIWLLAIFWIWKLFETLNDLRRLRRLQDFYRYLLEVRDSDIQTVRWQEIVKKLMDLRDLNPTTAAAVKDRHRHFMGTQSKQRMDAHDIANRLMRKDNYLIALINKDVLDFTLPIPFLGNRQLFSKTMQWNLSLCILDHVFDDRGQVRSLFLKDTHRRVLSDSLAQRFKFAAFMNAICAPFIVIFFMLFYFFRYFNEYQRNPSQIGSRQYTPLAEWKFRQFNELGHFFEERTNMSYPFATRYVDQFPKDKTAQLAKFVAFVAGALVSVLAVASVIDPESFLAFEITPERTVLFYLGVFGTVWAVARGVVPEEHMVFDPETALKEVIGFIQYQPTHWQGHLHSNEVRADFSQLYKMKLLIFLEEIISILLTPLVLWFSLPGCSDRVVDFFREFTLHVDGLGYVCSFAVFDFKSGEAKTAHTSNDEGNNLRGDYYSTKHDKMAASYWGFMDHYANNNARGPQYRHADLRQSFHAPPAFPGLLSSAVETSAREQIRGKLGGQITKMPNRSVLVGSGFGNRSVHHRTSKFGPIPGSSSPMSSVLLDPQHQPTKMNGRSQRKFGAHSRLRASHRPLEGQVEDNEEGVSEVAAHSGNGSGDGEVEDDLLGESWKTTRAGNRDEDVEEDIQTLNNDQDPGVLGLVYQFSKTQTDGRGTGVNL